MYAEIVKDPLIVAALSALIGVALSQLGSYLYGLWAHSKKRKSILRVLRDQLENHRQQLSELEDSLEKNLICGALDPSPVLQFLNGDVVALPKDKKLVTALYKHLGSIEMLRHAIGRIDMCSAGWATPQIDTKEALEQNLKKVIPSMQAVLDLCLKELPQCRTA